MVYCPKCHEVINEIICPYCDIDVMCYNEQNDKVHKSDINTLRSNHRVMDNLQENQEKMNEILRKEDY